MVVRAISLCVWTVAAAVGLGGCSAAKPAEKPEDDRPRVASFSARVATIHPTIELPGAIAPAATIALSNSINEPTLRVDVREGDRVKSGQELAALDVSDLEASLQSAIQTARSDEAKTSATVYGANLVYAQAPDTVRQSQAQLEQAREASAEARRNLTRDTSLADQGYLPAQNLDEQRVVVKTDAQAELLAQAALRSAVASQVQNGTPQGGMQASEVEEFRRQAAAAYATAAQLRAQIARARIVSPVDGTLVNRNLNPGEYPSGRQIFTVEANDTVYAILTASAAQRNQLRTNDRTEITQPGIGAVPAFGRIEALLDASTAGATNFTVKVPLANTDGSLHAGVPVRAIVDLGGVRGVGVPTTAFVSDDRSSVLAVAGGEVRTVNVRELATDGMTSIVAGLGRDAVVVRDGTSDLHDGEAVKAVR